MPCNIPTQIVKPLTVIKHLVSSPLDDKDISYYTALSKQSHSYNELLFIAAKTISYMVQTEQNHTVQTEQKHCYNNQKSPPKSPIKQTTSEKLSNILNNRALKDLTQLLDPYKRNSSVSPITTLNHLIHCHNRTSQLLQTLDFDSQRITQSSQAIQSALESMNTLFNTLNIHKLVPQVIQVSLIFTRSLLDIFGQLSLLNILQSNIQVTFLFDTHKLLTLFIVQKHLISFMFCSLL